jgi:predicted naringenin-chalcone synthase
VSGGGSTTTIAGVRTSTAESQVYAAEASAKQAEIITQATFERICRMFSMNGWRKCEPQTQYPSEKTILFKQLVYRALAEDYISESKAAELLGLSVIKFHQQRTLDFDPVTH